MSHTKAPTASPKTPAISQTPAGTLKSVGDPEVNLEIDLGEGARLWIMILACGSRNVGAY